MLNVDPLPDDVVLETISRKVSRKEGQVELGEQKTPQSGESSNRKRLPEFGKTPYDKPEVLEFEQTPYAANEPRKQIPSTMSLPPTYSKPKQQQLSGYETDPGATVGIGI